jgi:hypothetical protein
VAEWFPPPWTVEDHNEACFIVKACGGQALAYEYYEEEAGAAWRRTSSRATKCGRSPCRVPSHPFTTRGRYRCGKARA